jgi:hypothetical protein
MGAALFVSGACYTYSVVPSTNVVADERVEFRLSDQGRVTMQRDLGPGALTVEGRVIGSTDSVWTLKVYRLTTIDGSASIWAGEEINLPRSAVYLTSTRRLDRQASVVAAAGVTGALALFVVSRSLLGGGGLFGEKGGPIATEIRR